MAQKSRKHLQNLQQNIQEVIPTLPTYIAGIYARVSSDDNPDSSIENQIKIAETFISERPNVKLHKVYMDNSISAFAYIRPGFEDMLYDIQNNAINCVIVKDVSRFSRDYLEAGDLLQIKFPVWRTRFISINDGFDSLYADATSLQMALRTLIAYEYSKDLSKKISSAISISQINGTYIPPRLPYGYKKSRTSEGREWQLDESASKVVKEVFDSALNGNSACSIARGLNIRSIPAPKSKFWTPSSVLRILRNETYIGTFITGKTHNELTEHFEPIPVEPDKWIRHKFYHVPIIDESAFYKVQKELEKRSFPKKKSGKDDFFLGKLYCGICDRKMKYKKAVNGSIYYVCPRKDESNACPNKAISAKKIKERVYKHIRLKIDEMKAYQEKMLWFENTPYFMSREKELNRRIEVLRTELDCQIELFRSVNETSTKYRRSDTTDVQELFRYLVTVRNDLREKIAELDDIIGGYWRDQSSKAEFLKPFLELENVDTLTGGIMSRMVKKVSLLADDMELYYNVEHYDLGK